MASIDELFRKPNAGPPLTNIKRKFDTPDAHAAYKATKLSAGADVKGKSNGSATVEHAEDEDEDDAEAGPALPPDEEDEADSDDEGRFFGGGVTRDSREAMAYLDAADGEEEIAEELIDAAWARRLAVNLEKRISRNAEQRARFEGEPQKFMQSEAELDVEIKGLSVLTGHAEFYGEFVTAEGPGKLVGLLAHENTDIAINAMETVSELLDEDVEAPEDQWGEMVTALLDADLVSLLEQNLERLHEDENESDRQGVYHSLAVLEALGERRETAEQAGTESILKFLLARIQKEEEEITQNKQYASEVLQILLQGSEDLRKRALGMGAMAAILEPLAKYRRKDPESNSLEEEYANNLFDTVVCLVRLDEGKQAFLDEEGVELMLIMIREGKWSKTRAIEALSDAVIGHGQAACSKLVEAGGLKTLFGLFKKKLGRALQESLVNILAALLYQLPGESPERIRTLAKFAEKDSEKTAKLLDWRQTFVSKVFSAGANLDPEEQEAAAGLSAVYTINIILAWLVAEDRDLATKIVGELKARGLSLGDIKTGLEEQLQSLEESEDDDYADMIKTLIDALP